MLKIRNLAVATAFSLALMSTSTLAQTVNVGVQAPPTSIDPHFHTLTPNISLASNIFETLIGRDKNAKLIPLLATSWTAVDDKSWEFKLRKGVKFHDGTDFTAADVKFSIERAPNVPNSPSSYGVYLRDISDVQIVDDYTIIFKTKAPAPLLPLNIANIYIVSDSIRDTSSTADFNSGKAAIGTGPFKLAKYLPGDRAVLSRFADYWGSKASIETVNYRFIQNDGARIAALLSNDVQLIDTVPPADVERLKSNANVKIAEITGLRFIYIVLSPGTIDQVPLVKGPNGEKLDKNPLSDRRVRKALSLAINRPVIADRLMKGLAVPAGQFMPKGAFGYAPDIEVPKYSPDRAKELLAEAGYPKGFSITLTGPNDRYQSDGEIQQAVGQMWTRIGVKTSVEPLPYASFATRASKFEFPAFLQGWSNGTGEPSPGWRALIATRDESKGWGMTNRGQYSNPEFDKMLETAVQTVDDKKREDIFIKMDKIIEEETPLIPIHHQKNIWATSKDFVYEPRVDELTVLQSIKTAD